MGDDDTGPGSRPLRLLGGSVAALAGLAALAFLCVAGVVVWMFAIALPRHQDKIDDQATAAARRIAEGGQQRLASAAADGKLADTEVTAALGSMWTIERSADRWAVTARFPAGSKELCFRYDVILPLGPGVRVTRTALPDCPVIGPHPDAS